MFLSYMPVSADYIFFFCNDTATTEIYTLSLHDALPISCRQRCSHRRKFASPVETGDTRSSTRRRHKRCSRRPHSSNRSGEPGSCQRHPLGLLATARPRTITPRAPSPVERLFRLAGAIATTEDTCRGLTFTSA